MALRNLLLAVIGGALLAQPQVSAQEGRRVAGFFKRTLEPNLQLEQANPLSAFLCKTAAGLRRLAPCPALLADPVSLRGFLPPQDLSAFLPHLRLNILLRRMENKLVSGQGIAIDQSDLNEYIYATWKIQSTAAWVQLPTPAAEGYGLPAPNPGQVWDVGPYASGIYQGIITNGCSPATVFDVKLISTILKNTGGFGSGDKVGEVELLDSVVGNGFYNFSYTIRASDSDGVSDFIFSGDARAYCTAQLAL